MRWFSLLIVVGLAASASAEKMKPDTKTDAKAGKAEAKAEVKAEPKASDAELKALTDDAVFGHDTHRVDGEETHGVVAFTFDDGPNPATTPAVIDALEKYDIPATFFIITSRIGKSNPKSSEVLARELADGFTIGSHSVTHPNLKAAGGDTITKEIDNSFRTLSKATSKPIGMFRPPYGALSGAGRARLRQLGVTEVIWSVDTLDWKAKDADKLRKKVFAMITKQNGGIVLMHDVKPITAKIIADVLDDLEAENCSRLAAHKDPIWPVSLHYFLRDGKNPRAIPAEVQKRTDAYKTKLPGRCAKRPAPEKKDAAPQGKVPANDSAPINAKPVKADVGDFPAGAKAVKPACLANPLAPGCHGDR